MRPEKESIVREITEALEASEFAFLADYSGMNVKLFAELRGALVKAGSEVHVLKNSFMGIALGKEQSSALAGNLAGPTCVITGSGEPTEVAKILKQFTKTNTIPVVKGGILNDQILAAADVDMMADIPSREILLSQLVGTVQAPMTSLVGVMNAKVLSLLYVLNAIEEQKKNAA